MPVSKALWVTMNRIFLLFIALFLSCSSVDNIVELNEVQEGCVERGIVRVDAYASDNSEVHIRSLKEKALKNGANSIVCCTFVSYSNPEDSEEQVVGKNPRTREVEGVVSVVASAYECKGFNP